MGRRTDVTRLVRWYPEAWRERYGDELAALMEDHLGNRSPSLRFRSSIVRAGLGERAREAGFTGRSSSPVERARAGTLLVLFAWTAFVIAGASFSKLSEHFGAAVPSASRSLPSAAFSQVQTVAIMAAVLVVVGGITALPAFTTFLRAGGSPAIRRSVLRAATLSAVTVAAAAALIPWAHALSNAQRNGTDAAYMAAFAVWAVLLVATLCSWTQAGSLAERRLVLSRRALAVESVLAVAVAAAMISMTVATAIWWAAMAEHAPWFLHGTPVGTNGSPFDLRLAATMGLMVVAIVVGEYGVARIGRAWVELLRRTPA